MKYFKKISEAQVSGLKPFGVPKKTSTDALAYIGNLELNKNLGKYLLECNPFVFAQISERVEIPRKSTDFNPFLTSDELFFKDRGNRFLDLPFQICSFEPYGSTFPTNSAWTKNIRCVVVIERTPGDYLFIYYGDAGSLVYTESNAAFDIGQDDPELALETREAQIIFRVVLNSVNALNTQSCGVQEIKERIKIRTSDFTKESRTVRQIIHVSQKKERAAYCTLNKIEIDWKSRWMVRGHWRKHDGLGKDRNGDYTVEDATWVKEHVKGPEAAELVKKTRFVEENFRPRA